MSGLAIAQCPIADFDSDCDVDHDDLLIFAEQWLEPTDYLNEGLVARWQMDVQAGSATIADSSGNGHGGIARNTALSDAVEGRLESAMAFDGSDDYVEVAYDPSLNQADFTVTFWARVDGKPDSYSAPVCSRDYSDSLGLGYEVGTGYNVYIGETNKWEFWMGTGLTSYEGFHGVAGPDIEFGAWTHVAITFDATGGPTNGVYTGIKKLYINGSEITSATVTNARYAPNTTQPLTLGRVNHSQKWYFQGLLEDVRVYDHALAAEDIRKLGKPGPDMNQRDGVSTVDFARFAGDWMEKGAFDVRINEIHYDPDVKTELVEFVELYNSGSATADISGWYFSSGIDYTFPQGSLIPVGGYKVIAMDAADFNLKFVFNPDGVFSGSLSNDGETVRLRDSKGKTVDAVDYKLGFPWPTVGDAVPVYQPGTGYSIQLLNPQFDNDLGGNWGNGAPTPRRANYVIAANAAPQMRQVSHKPKQPASSVPVIVTAKVTDPDGVASVSVRYQVVEPGQYISVSDAAYNTSWSAPITMYDDGVNGGDITAGDDVYSGVIPSSVQVHRRLIRYRVSAVDGKGLAVTAPYADDPSPNFAYFVYDGVPAWTGAVNPNGSAPLNQQVTYGTDVMRSLPVYQLISKNQDVADAQHIPNATTGGYGGSDYLWKGALVYDGEVYDHIRYRARGGVWRYSMGKNMWKFDFNRGHYFQARDDYGRKYDTKWDKINFSACIQQGDYLHRGEQGMFEAVGFKVFNLMGCEAPKTSWVQFRVIDNASEYTTQYDGDFWGLYMNIEQMDGRFLDEHGLPDGNLYKIEGHNVEFGEANNQGPTGVTDLSDYAAFKGVLYGSSNPTEAWWRNTVNLESYWGYRCVVEGIHHGDIGYGKNYFYYLHPETNIWTMLPWDLDLTWANNMYGNGEDPFKNEGWIFGNSQLRLEYDNRLREFHDLVYNSDQMDQLIDEFAAVIDPPEAPLTIVDADRAMWDYNPILVSSYVNSSKAGHGRFYQRAATKDFRGMCQIMKDYVSTGPRSFNSYWEDPAIPLTPALTYLGDVNRHAINDLHFEVDPFADPQGAGTFSAMKWRIAEVAAGSQAVPVDPATVLVDEGQSWLYFKGTSEPSANWGEWRQLYFDDSSWPEGNAGFGYSSDDDERAVISTFLDDMSGKYSTFYLRKEFTVEDVADFDELLLEARYDDGVNVWINGHYAGGIHTPSEELAYDATVGNRSGDDPSFYVVNHLDPPTYLENGTNIIAVQVLNTSLSGSSDCYTDIRLTGLHSTEPPVYVRSSGKYEIEPVWESDEVGAFQNEIWVPASAVKSGRTYRVRAGFKDTTGRWSHWSDPYQFVSGEPIAADILQNLRITEVMYNPADGDEHEFIELKNIGDEVIDLSGVRFDAGISFDFNGPESTVTSINPGGFLLVVRDKAAFQLRYPSVSPLLMAGEYGNLPGAAKLSNSGETVRLVDFRNGTIADFDYNEGRGWPISADGGGHSLVPVDSAIAGQPDGSCKYGGNWRASGYIGGSPGADDPAVGVSAVINEVMAHTDYSNPAYPEYDSNDWIELYNAAGTTVQLNGDWYLSDDVDNLRKWSLPVISLSTGGYTSFDEVTGFHNPITTGFGLNKAGEQVFLSYLPSGGPGRIVDYVKFKGQANFMSWGRYPDGGLYWYSLNPSRDNSNNGPIGSVVISEIMYNPVSQSGDPYTGDDYEYVELYNPSAQAVNLFNSQGPWQLDGEVSCTFADGASIGGGQRLVIAADATAFKDRYGFDPDGVFGSGNLSNRGGRVTLEQAEAPDLPDPTVPWIIVDEVIYGDYTPWPITADGGGDGLVRISTDPSASGNDPTNWQAAAPSPGQ
jgi:hypothetical protein